MTILILLHHIRVIKAHALSGTRFKKHCAVFTNVLSLYAIIPFEFLRTIPGQYRCKTPYASNIPLYAHAHHGGGAPFHPLSRPEQPVAGVPEAWNDKAVLVQLFIDAGQNHIHVVMGLKHRLKPLRSRDYAHQLYVFAAGAL